jgi:flagellum-specific peptidoglycan hydrolase FlgJ
MRRTPKSRRIASWTSACALGVAVLSAVPTVAAAQAGPTARQRTAQEQEIVAATMRWYKVRADLLDVQTRLAETRERLAAAERALAETDAALAEVRGQLSRVRSALQARAAIVYQRNSDRLGMTFSIGRVVDISAGNRYAESVAALDNREIARLGAVVAELERRRAQQEAVRLDLAERAGTLQREEAELQAVADRESAAVERLGGVPIMGQPTLTAAELAAWFRSTGQRARLAGNTTIDELAAMYISEGEAENVRGDLAFAQAVLETGSFGHATDNNFAGIGACDSCSSQFLFPTPRDGVRAQIQLLLNYADPNSRGERLRNPLDPTLHGRDPARAVYLFDSFPFKGRAPVWNVMGAGNWATDPLYAGKVLNIYSRMLAFKSGR